MVRTPCCKAEGLKKGAWTPEEDQKLIDYINKHGEGGWRTLPEKAGLQRCGKSCRLRWANYLRPDIKRGDFSAEDEATIIKLHAAYGNKWSAIARGLSGRTDNEIKNYWNTHIKKRLIKKGIDPVTHKPISEKSDREAKPNPKGTDKDSPETMSGKSDNDNSVRNSRETTTNGSKSAQCSSSGSARLLNRVANRFGQRSVNQSVLTEIIEGGAVGCENVVVSGPTNNSSSLSSTSKPLNNMTMSNAATTTMIRSIFDGTNQERPPSASSSAFSESSASINGPPMYCMDTPTGDYYQGISSETEYNDTEIFEFLNNLSNSGGGFAEDVVVENSGFMKEIENILLDDQNCNKPNMVVPLMEVNESVCMDNGEESYGRAFEEIESYLDDCMYVDK